MADQTIIRADDVVITGNLEVTGSQISTTTTDTAIKDRLITLNSGGTLGTNTAGIEVESGGSIEATLGYTASAGWNFGNKNITTTGTITGTLSLAADSINDTHIDFGTGANQVNTDDLPEGSTNEYYTNAKADARIGAAQLSALSNVHTVAPTDGQVLAWDNGNSRWAPADRGHTNTDSLSEGSTNLYYTNARARAAISLNGASGTANYNSSTGVLTVPSSTTHIAEGTNEYYTDAKTDARIAAASIDDLSDVGTSGATAGEVLMWNGSQFTPQAPAVGIANYQKVSSTASMPMGSLGTSYASSGTFATINSFSVSAGGPLIQLSFAAQIVQETNGAANIGVFRAFNGEAMTYTTPIAQYTSMTADFVSSFTITDDLPSTATIGGVPNTSVTAVEYQLVVKFDSGSTNVYELNDISFSATEFAIGTIDTLPELSDVTIASQQTGQILYANSPTTWVNQTPTISLNSDVTVSTPATNQILRYNGSQWINGDLSPFNIGDLGNVDTTGAANNKILKYNGTTWVVADDNYEDGIVNVVEDTTPQLGGDLDVQTNSIISTGSNNITLDPQGTGSVQILGDLTVTGTATTLDVTNMAVEDPIILLNKHGTQPATNSTDAGIMIQRGSSENNAAWFWDEDDDRWTAATTTSTETATDITETALADIQAGTAHLTATQAQYADLAEIYESDADYEPVQY